MPTEGKGKACRFNFCSRHQVTVAPCSYWNMRTNRDTLLNKLPLKNGSLLQAVQERVSAKRKKVETSGLSEMIWGSHVANLPSDLVFKIFLLLPAESLHIASLVCKAWFHLINSSSFIEAHTPKSKTVLIYLQSVSQTRPKTFSIETKLGQSKHTSIFLTREPPRCYITFLEIQDGKGKVSQSNISGCKDILANCNGLILATGVQIGGLIVMNPATRKLIALPLGTNLPRGESYGFVFSHSAREYKVVHLFADESSYIGCEILSLGMKSWRAVDGPSLGLFRKLPKRAVSAIGSLHWLPALQNCTYLVSMGIDDEKFVTRPLPVNSRVNDKLAEIGGFLSFVTHETPHKIEIWVLSGLPGEDWIKRHTIASHKINDMIPLCAFQFGRELIFARYRDSSLYAYDMEIEEMIKVEIEGEPPGHGSRSPYLPHVNTLASWEAPR